MPEEKKSSTAEKKSPTSLSEEDRRAISAWMKEQWRGEKGCPVSGKANWAFGEDLVELRPYAGGGLIMGGSVYPAVMVICRDCGYTRMFNAMLMDLPSLKKREEESNGQ